MARNYNFAAGFTDNINKCTVAPRNHTVVELEGAGAAILASARG